jgi:DNA-binding NtrC family response regulator
MEPQKQILIASSNLETHQRFTRIFTPWHLDLLSCSSLKSAQEILVQGSVFLIFCENRLADGNFHELLEVAKDVQPIPRLVVAFRTPNDYEMLADAAIQRGAYATLGPFSDDRDVEDLLIRAIHDNAWSHAQMLGRGTAFAWQSTKTPLRVESERLPLVTPLQTKPKIIPQAGLRDTKS